MTSSLRSLPRWTQQWWIWFTLIWDTYTCT